MDILDTNLFKKVMYFKFFMVIVIWGLLPLLLPEKLFPFFGLILNASQIMLVRIWGIIVLLDTFLYICIYKYPHAHFTRFLLLFGVLDNGGLGLIILILTPILHLPWGIWISVPFQLFFGYWFWQFYKKGSFKT